MADPLIDLTLPEDPKPRRQGTPKPSTRAKVQGSRATTPRVDPEEAKAQRKAEKAQKYQEWIEANLDPWYMRGAGFLLGANPGQVMLNQPDGSVKSVAEVISWKESPKAFMAARAVVELEELPQIQRVVQWFGPIAPWLMLGGVGVAIGMDAVSMMRLKPVLRQQAAQQIPEQPQAQPQPQPQPEAQAA